ncbi:MAG: hypothetical protein ACRDZN_12040 [Acidimicrobiales bacterium]
MTAGEDTGWLLTTGEPAEIWEVGSDGTLTRRAELAGSGSDDDAESGVGQERTAVVRRDVEGSAVGFDGGDEITAFGDGAAVTRFRCTDPADEERGAPVAELLLIDPHGWIDHELTLAHSNSGGLEGVGMRVVGSSDDHVWVEVSIDSVQLFAVRRSGDVETIPFVRRRFADDRLCAVGGELIAVRVHTDLYDPELGPSDTGVAVTPETPIRTTVGAGGAGGAGTTRLGRCQSMRGMRLGAWR